MKRLIGIILCLSVLMIACNKKQTVDKIVDDNKLMETNTQVNTNKNINKTMYVNATEGLRVRNSPSADGEKAGLLNYLSEVNITKEDNNTVNIGGVDGKWVYITTPIEGWIFDGFLEDFNQHYQRIEQIKKNLVGTWKVIDVSLSPDTKEYNYFLGKMIFMESQEQIEYMQLSWYDFEFGVFRGVWNWEHGKNTISLMGGWDTETESSMLLKFDVYYLTDVNFIDNDHITLYSEIQYYLDNILVNGFKKAFLKLERVK